MRGAFLCLPVLAWFAVTSRAQAWIFHEHFRITERAVEGLPARERAELNELWQHVRRSEGGHVCPDPVHVARGEDGPICIPFTMLPAIAADHSCSPREMLRFVASEDWMLRVVRIGAETEVAMAEADNDRERIDAWDAMHLALERSDFAYTSRATANDGHFLLPRRTGDLRTYLNQVLAPGQDVSAAMLYAVYHVAAIDAARGYALAPAGSSDRTALAIEALTSESFALHFLQDTFAAGHVVGVWGGKATKKGTHDLYSIEGLDVFTWQRVPYSAHGDAFMKPVDLSRASDAVRNSLAAVLRTALGEAPPAGAPYAAGAHRSLGQYDVCSAESVDVTIPQAAVEADVVPIWSDTPMPSSPRDQTPPPRERAEIGPYVAFQSGGAFNTLFGGYQSPEEAAPRPAFALSAAAGIGYGLEGITTSAGDGRAFLMAGVDAQSAQYDSLCSGDCVDERNDDSLVPRVPSRIGYQVRLRMPFWLVPGDLLVAAPFLALISMPDLTKMGILAADGGLIPWQRVFPTAVGDFQFVVGRELAITYYDMDGNDAFYAFGGQDESGQPVFIPTRVKSLAFSFPLLEYRPFRAFHGRLVSSVAAQLGVGFETPIQVKSLRAGVAAPDVEGSFLAYLRVHFDGRAYF